MGRHRTILESAKIGTISRKRALAAVRAVKEARGESGGPGAGTARENTAAGRWKKKAPAGASAAAG